MAILIPTPVHLFQHTVTVQNMTWTQENTGAPELSGSLPEPFDVAAFVQPVSAADSMQYGRDTQTKLCRVFLDVVNDDGTAYSIKQGDTVAFEGSTYRVVECDVDLCEVGTLRRAVIELVV